MTLAVQPGALGADSSVDDTRDRPNWAAMRAVVVKDLTAVSRSKAACRSSGETSRYDDRATVTTAARSSGSSSVAGSTWPAWTPSSTSCTE